jgi:hypothetical protein
MDYERERMDKKRKEDGVFFSGFINDTAHKYEALKGDCSSKFTCLEGQL